MTLLDWDIIKNAISQRNILISIKYTSNFYFDVFRQWINTIRKPNKLFAQFVQKFFYKYNLKFYYPHYCHIVNYLKCLINFKQPDSFANLYFF